MSADRRYTAEVRLRGSDELWGPEPKDRDVKLATLVGRWPSPAWPEAASRIAALRRGDHTRIEIDADTAIVLERV